MRHLALGSVALLLTLTACASGNDSSEPAEPVTVTETVPIEDPTEAQSASEDPFDDEDQPLEPNVGENALRIGEPRVGRDLTTVVLKAQVDYPGDPERYREAQPGNEFFGLRISQCLKGDSEAKPGEIMSSGAGDFYLAMPDGTQAPGGTTYNDWPTPKFPEYVTLNPGDCLKGWIALEVPESKVKPTKVIWRPAGQTLAEWLL